ncbi:hypothetical protein QFZ99_005709 [Paraburkholderia atlantica]|uniref:hypothetical protein n=1 Tax=Paraburkholderia atlantica TaxID=2654982 RepID=UPI003D1B68E6
MDAATQFARSQEIAGNIAYVLQKRAQNAVNQYGKRLREAVSDGVRMDQSCTLPPGRN